MNSTLKKIITALAILALLAGLAMSLRPVRERVSWRVDNALTWLRFILNPPEKVDFSLSSTSAPITPDLPTVQPSATPAVTLTPPEATAFPPTPTLTATPLPPYVRLTGVKYQTQHGYFNYCAPANLFMALSYWGWQGSVTELGPALKPFAKDKNVMPYELVDYVNTYTSLKAVERVGRKPGITQALSRRRLSGID